MRGMDTGAIWCCPVDCHIWLSLRGEFVNQQSLIVNDHEPLKNKKVSKYSSSACSITQLEFLWRWKLIVTCNENSSDRYDRVCVHLDAWPAARAICMLMHRVNHQCFLSPKEQTDLLCPVMPAAIVEAAEMYAVMRRYVRRGNVVCIHPPLPISASATQERHAIRLQSWPCSPCLVVRVDSFEHPGH
jgi:hypothetical protein